ncbi:MAG: hypothetical protein E2O65_02310 [Gammaproteobacteria bacterium]|nr:MAG: hypothetical protein E2O65_02310 [Gammaproteobacteria bacterium]
MTNRSIIALLAGCMLAAGFLPRGALAASDADIQAARQELHLRTETERRMRRDFESLLGNSQMSATEISAFENYLAGLGKMVDEQRRLVASLEGRDVEGAGGSSRVAALPAEFDRGQTDDEKIALLDAELGNSLSAFDEKLLREQRELAEKSRSVSASGSGEQRQRGEGASGKAGDGEGDGEGEKAAGGSGGEVGESGSESAAGGAGGGGESERQAESGRQSGTGGEGAQGNERVASAGGASGDGRQAGKTSTPPDIPDGKDDDIVARQLREAAENEQDPELRDKLWEEYRKYKTRGP